MLCMVLGVLLGALFYYLSIEKIDLESKIAVFLTILELTVPVCGFCIGLFLPTGYKEPVLVNEIELISLNNELTSTGKGNWAYVSVTADNTYSYRYEVNDKYNLDGKSYKIGTVSENVTEVETKECDKAVLQVYKVKPKITLVSFGLGASKTEYVFYVPEGTIQKEIVLK